MKLSRFIFLIFASIPAIALPPVFIFPDDLLTTECLGVCKELDSCPSALENWRTLKIRPKTCYFEGDLQFVCCEEKNEDGDEKPQRISEQSNYFKC